MTKISRPIKTVLTDGKIVQGIGNAYVDEILYAAKLSPCSIIAKIPEEKITMLTKAIKLVLREAQAHILKNFPDTITEKERDFFKVHRPKRKNTPNGKTILKQRSPLEKLITPAGRSYLDKLSPSKDARW